MVPVASGWFGLVLVGYFLSSCQFLSVLVGSVGSCRFWLVLGLVLVAFGWLWLVLVGSG